MTGRSHIQEAVERELGGRVISVSVKPRGDDIVTFLRARLRLRMDTTPEVVDSGLKKDIMKIIPDKISETYVVVREPGNLCRSYTDR